MADNFLENRYDEVFRGQGGTVSRGFSLDAALTRNRSVRGFNRSYKVHPLQMEAILSVNNKIPSGMNAQNLRFRAICGGPQAEVVLGHIRMGGALPELHLPLPGTEPEAFIVVCSKVGENPIVDIDLGISLQSMLLKAVEMGLNGLIIRNFDRDELMSGLSLPLPPLAVLAIGKSAEKITLVKTAPGEPLAYYRRDGIHYVPKLQIKDLKI